LVIAAWYLVGVFARSRNDERLGVAWLAVLAALWAGASFLVTADFVWLAFPLFYLYLWMLRARAGLLSVAGGLGIAIGALAIDGGLEIAEVIGPVVGAVVAVISASSYKGLLDEHRRTQELLAELEATRDLLAEAERESGALEERRRIAREVHDTIAQGLSSIILLSRAAKLSPGDEQERIREIEGIAQDNLDEARRIVAALNPTELDDDPLPQAMEHVTSKAADAAGIKSRFAVAGESLRMSLDSEVVFLRIAQEALANVRAHARAYRVDVSLTYAEDGTTLEVADDGVGFDRGLVGRTSDSGFGLQVMEERVAAVEGTLTVASVPGSGTVVSAWIPRMDA
jgi:signal transduction histidine kinase